MRLLSVLFFMCGCVTGMCSSNVFPLFESRAFIFAVPTNTPGILRDIGHEVGTNYVYQLNGQLFLGDEGHIQTPAEGFSGETDESTPWKTLTELFAVYHRGASREEITPLYDSDSIGFIKMVYGDKMQASFQASCRSVEKMSVVLGFDYSNYYMAFVRLSYSDGHHNVIPFVFARNYGKYKLSAAHFDKPSAVFLNVGGYLNNVRTSNNR